MSKRNARKRSSRSDGQLRPYFQSGGITLYHGDCLQVLPSLPAGTAAAAIADPPYCSGGQSAGERARDPREKYCQDDQDRGRPSFAGDTLDQRSFLRWCALWLGDLRRVLADRGYCLIFSDWRQLPTATDALQMGGFVWRGLVSWDKGRGARAPHKGYVRHQCEYLAWGTNGKVPRAQHAGPFDGCIEAKVRKSDKWHMTGKPTELLQDLVQIAPPGELVLDPFAGSSTSGVACALAGRRWIGVEQSDEYCEISARRLEAAVAGDLLRAA